MKPTLADGQNESAGTPWPSVPKIDHDEFQQSNAVAQLAVRLCELKKVTSKIPLEKENLDPEKFLEEAWELIEKAREHVLRQQTGAEYLAQHGGGHEAAEKVIDRILPKTIDFNKLCDPKRNAGDTELIKLPDCDSERPHEVIWKVFRSKHGFDNLFWDYWNDCGEQWTQWMKGEKPRTPWMKRDAVTFAKLAHNKEKYPGGFKQLWKERGQSMLASWKRDGVPANDFLALAKFRRERDKRALNLKKKPKGKRRRGTVTVGRDRRKRREQGQKRRRDGWNG
jgi:hypothetical protein